MRSGYNFVTNWNSSGIKYVARNLIEKPEKTQKMSLDRLSLTPSERDFQV